MRLKTVFEPSDEGGFTAYVPALPGCISEGDNLDEARVSIREAIALWLKADDLDVQGSAVVEEIAL